MKQTISFAHAGGLEDIVYAVPAILSVLEYHRADRALLLLQLGWETRYSGGHPLGNKLLNDEFVRCLTPWLKAQPCIEDIRIHRGEPVDVDLHGFRRLPINPSTH